MTETITQAKLATLITNGESEVTEFKESFNDEAIETLVAFMNAKGGTLLIGVKNTGNICGYSIGKKTLEDIANQIQASTDPRIQPSISTINHEGKVIVVITVSPSISAPINMRGKYVRRVGRTNQRMSHEEIMQRIVASNGISWDAAIEPIASLSELNMDEVDKFVEIVKKVGRQPIPANTPSIKFLQKIELVKDDKPTRASLLLFGNNPRSYFSSAFLKLGRFRSPILIVDDREAHGTLINQLDETMAWFKERLETEFIITGNPQREVRWEYPLDAIREAVINLLCHRDYTSLAHSQIRLYDDKLEFWNAGSLPGILTPELLLVEHDSMPRNSKIADAFFYMGLIEQWGSGTTRIASELQAYGYPLPQFKAELGRFRLIFYRTALIKELLKNANLSERQLKATAYVKDHGSIDNSKYQELSNVSKSTATRELKELVEKGIFVVEGSKGQGVKYKFK